MTIYNQLFIQSKNLRKNTFLSFKKKKLKMAPTALKVMILKVMKARVALNHPTLQEGRYKCKDSKSSRFLIRM